MQLPPDLAAAIDRMMQKMPPTILRKAQEALSTTYRNHRTSSSIFQDEAQKLVYLATRFPATYAAVAQVLQRCSLPSSCLHWIDLGAGPGTASLAAMDIFPNIKTLTLIERSKEAISLGKKLRTNLSQNVEWICQSLPFSLPKADVAIASYALGELSSPETVIDDWWKSDISFLIVIEPGTPTGFNLIKKIRNQILALGAHLLAPCPHSFSCPMQGKDWCHFSVRVERSRLHRYLKTGFLGYEDEKYSYLVISRAQPSLRPQARILRHPQKNSGHVKLILCDLDGTTKEKVITKSNQEFYRKARHAEWGETF